MTRGVAGSGLMLAGLFLAFLAALAPEPAGAGAASVLPQVSSTARASSSNGELLFRTKGCAACHSVAAMGIRAYVPAGPDLSAAAADFGGRREGLSAFEYLTQSMRAPQAFLAPGGTGTIEMPDLGLSDGEIDALARFLLGR